MKKNGKILVVSFQSLTKNSGGGMARLGYYVSEQLHKRGLLKKFVVHSKGKFETPFPSEPVSNQSKYYLYFLNKLWKKIKFPEHKFRLWQEHLFDIFCQLHIKKDVDILFTTNAHLERTFKKAKQLGIQIIYVPANPEENYIYNLVKEENEKLGITEDEPYTYAPRLKFYNDSIKYVDTVLATYPTVYTSYKNSGKDYELVHINGHLKPDFDKSEYTERSTTNAFRIIYIATTVPLKGLQYLLEAWKQMNEDNLTGDMELHVVGRIEVSVRRYVDKHYANLDKVHFTGRIQNISGYLQSKDLSVVPSLTDGGPYVALEAAHYGLPVILTENCGSAELLGREPSGCIVIPIRDVAAIKKAILHLKNNRQEALQLGKNAKYQLDNYKMDEFILKVTDYLEAALAAKTNKHG